MKKYILLLSLILGSILSYGQTYTPVGNSNQRALIGGRYFYRTSLGSTGFAYWYTKEQIDSLFGLNPILTFGNGLTKTGNNVNLGGAFTDNTILNTNGFGTAITNLTGNSGILQILPTGAMLGVATNGSSSNYIIATNSPSAPSSIIVRDNTKNKGIFGEGAYFDNYNPITDSSMYAQYGGVKKLIDSASGNFVPYTGATSSVNLGSQTLNIGTNYISPTEASMPQTLFNGSIGVKGDLIVIGPETTQNIIQNPAAPTGTLILPKGNGTIARIEDIENSLVFYNIKDYGAVGDSTTDNTLAIKSAIAAMPPSGGNLFIPSGIYKVTYGLELNKPITVLGQGTIKQETDSTQVPGGAFPYSRFSVFKIMSNNVKIQDITISPKFEAIETLGFVGLTVDNVKIIGRRISKFSGIFLKDTKNIYINNTLITKIGTKDFDADRAGHGIHINTSENIRVNNCDIVDNGSNGIFCFVSSDIWVTNNNINYNGLSATQFSFATAPIYRQRNYHIINNNMEYNSADAVDVNDLNEISNGPRKIDMFITGNKSIGNGFFQGASTPDGSGVATLLNVASVVSTGNISKSNNAHGFYIYSSKNITSIGDQIISPNLTGFYLEASDSISISSATVNSVGSALRFTGTNSNINVVNNSFKSASSISLDYPNEATLTNYNISYNSFVGTSTINGIISLKNNYIECTTANTGLGIYSDNLSFSGNTVKAQNIALTMTGRTGVVLENNTFIGGASAAASLVIGSSVTMKGNKFQSIGTNPALFVTGESTLNMFFNDIGATGVGNNIRLDPGAPITVFQDKNVVHDGFPEYGSAIINNVVYDKGIPSQVQNSLSASTTIAPSASAVLAYTYSGTYTPTVSDLLNSTSITARLCHYTKIGNEVTVTGLFNMARTSSASNTALSVTLPISSNMTSVYDLSGTANPRLSANTVSGVVYGDASGDVAVIYIGQAISDGSNFELYFTFTYTIK